MGYVAEHNESKRCKQGLWPQALPWNAFRSKNCPSCGKLCLQVGEFEFHGESILFSRGRRFLIEPHMSKLLKLFSLRAGKQVPYDHMFEALWTTPDAEPEWPENVLKARLCHIRKEVLKPLDMKLKTVYKLGCRLEVPFQ